MTIHLMEVSKNNWFEVTQLQISEENGKRFIVPLVYSLAESKFESHLSPLAIYNDSELIGFTMYGRDPDDCNYWIYVFMIDSKHQKQGHGKASLKALIEHIIKNHKTNKILIGNKPENNIASKLYEMIGFKETGKIINNEIIREYCEC